MQQRIPNLIVDNITDINRVLLELRDLPPIIIFKPPLGQMHTVEVVTFSDTAFNVSPNQLYGPTDLINGISFRTVPVDATTYHLMNWASAKQQRFSYSSYGAKILACTKTDDREICLKQAHQSISSGDDLYLVLNVDSKGLFDTIITMHEGREYILQQTVQRIYDSFESRD